MLASIKKHPRRHVILLVVTLGFILLLAQFSPSETTLGNNLGLIYVHGTWAWAGKIAFGLAALSGLMGFILRKNLWHTWSLTLARTGLSFLLTMLPMSLLVMQRTWGGFYFDEPRWRIPFTFAIAGLLLQVGLHFFDSKYLSSAMNLVYGSAMWWVLGGSSNILHPDAAVSTSNSQLIQVYFGVMMAAMIVALIQASLLWFNVIKQQGKKQPMFDQ